MAKKWYLGKTKKDRYGSQENVYLRDFEWSCGWYWSGGWIGNNRFHAHFNRAFLDRPDSRGHVLGAFFDPWTKLPDYLKKEDVSIMQNGAAVWESLEFFLDNAQYTELEWWRIKDLFKQFYVLTAAAEAFQQGGHWTSLGRNPQEINADMAKTINQHIEAVIIPEIRKALDHES